MRYDDNLIEQVRERSDIVEIVGESVPLKRAGRNFKGLSPFKKEKTASFIVNPDKQLFHCFSSGVGGNVFNFVMMQENMSFPEAVRYLAERAHIDMPARSEQNPQSRSEIELIQQAYQMALEFYLKTYRSAQGGPARKYMAERGFSESTIDEFQIGWAPDAWRALTDHLTQNGFTEDLLVKARLANRSDKGRCYDFFRGRLLFPIRNLQGKVVAFGGRLVGQKEGPKYMNSSEHPAFLKRRELYGLYQAKRHLDHNLPRLTLVEGYMDFLKLYENGFKSTVATLGTALTADHVAVLKRFCQEVVVVYDGDSAGVAASLRGLEVFLDGGLNVKLVAMPEGEDPDDVLRKNGRDAFQVLLDGAKDFFDYKLDILLKQYNRFDSAELIKISNECFETLSKIKSSILLDRYLQRMSMSLGVQVESIRQEVQRFKNKPRNRVFSESGPATVVELNTQASEPPPEVKVPHDEAMLLALMMDEEPFRSAGLRMLKPTDFYTEATQEVYSQLKADQARGEIKPMSRYLSRIANQAFVKRLVQTVSFEWTVEEKQKAFKDCLQSITRKNEKRHLTLISQRIAEAERTKDSEKLLELMGEYQAMIRKNHVKVR